MDTDPGISSVEHGGFTVTSNSASAEQIQTSLDERDSSNDAKGSGVQETHTDNGEPDLSHAASELGKKGAAAAAEKRATDAKEAAKAEKEAKDAPEDKRKGNPRHDPTARVAQATKEAKEAREEAARLRSELDHERRSRPREREVEAPPQPPKQAKREGAPKSEDFETYEEFLDARDEHRDKIRDAEARQRWQDQNKRQHMQGYVQKFSQSIAKAGESVPDFHTRVSGDVVGLRPTFTLRQNDGPPDARNWIADEIVDNADQAPALMVHLSEHPEDFQRIAALSSPRAVTRAMAKLVTELDAEATANSPTPTVSRAPRPVRPVTGAPQFADDGGFREGMSLDDYARKWKPAGARR